MKIRLDLGISPQYALMLAQAALRYLVSAGGRKSQFLRKGVYNLVATYHPGSLLKRARKRSELGFAPEGFVVSVTDWCNLNCNICYPDAIKDGSVFIDLDKLDIVIQEMKREFGIRFVTLTGGEPLSHLREIAQRWPDVTFYTYTNATLLTREYCRDLQALGNVVLAVTIVGKKAIHDYIRGAVNYEKVMAAIDLLREFSLMWGFALTESRINYQEILEGTLLDELLIFNPLFFRLIPFQPVGRGANEWALSLEEFKRLAVVIGKKQKKYKHVIFHDYINLQSLGLPCMAGGARSFYLTEKLEVCPCVFMDLFTPINFSGRHSNLMEILINHHHFRNARDLAAKHPCIILHNPNWREDIMRAR
jgi:MoaA/NifB/PqqE/SkfB family radical SAM enzyme